MVSGMTGRILITNRHLKQRRCRHMNGWSGHTYRLGQCNRVIFYDFPNLRALTVKEDGSWHYVKSVSSPKIWNRMHLTVRILGSPP
jgi:hypothetical protein